jgi:hypothetical protein
MSTKKCEIEGEGIEGICNEKKERAGLLRALGCYDS